MNGNGHPHTHVACVHVDPRLMEQVLTFSGEVCDVAATLLNVGMEDEARRLLDALDRLNANPET